MIFLKLFLTFLKIGAVSFGGGYAMIPLIREEVLNNAWMSEEEFQDFIAVAESTPGPIAVNMATYIGATQGGVGGAALATLGVVLPAFLIILLISAILKNLLQYAGVKAALVGIRPVIAALILGTAVTMFLSNILGWSHAGDALAFSWRSAVIFVLLAAICLVYRKVRKKKFSPILLILISGGLGILLRVIPF